MSHFLTAKQYYLLVKRFLKEYTVFPKCVMELNLQDTTVIGQFPQASRLYGITPSSEVYEKMKQSDHAITCYKQSLSGFRVAQKMQLIYTMGARIHELSTEAGFKKLIQKAGEHLEPFGLFVFDFYTAGYYEKRSVQPAEITSTDHVVSVTSFHKKRTSYYKESTVFTKREQQLYHREDTSQKQMVYSLSKLKKLLSAHFEHVEFIDLKRKSSSKYSEYLLAVCQTGRQESE